MFWKTTSLFLLLLLLPFSTVSVPVERAKSERNIIYPKESYDDCVVDDAAKLKEPGRCKRFEECPEALKRWESKKSELKTCYFVKFDHYVCCPLDKSNGTDQNSELFEVPTIRPVTFAPITLNIPTIRVVTEETTTTESPKQFLRKQLTCYEPKVFRTTLVHGTPTKLHEFPFMAALGWNSNFDNTTFYRCGGSVVAFNFVLTAAHCIDFGGDWPATVSLGGSNLTAFEPGENYAVKNIYIHPEYNASSGYNDIALIELLSNSDPSSYRPDPVCLFDKEEISRQDLIALGYGQTRFAGLTSTQLLKAPLQTVNNADCQQHYSKELLPGGVLPSQLCAADVIDKLRDTCQGDSGGPLIYGQFPFVFLVGITSLGQGCANGPPSVYTRVSYYVDWVVNTIWSAQSASKGSTEPIGKSLPPSHQMNAAIMK